MTPEPQFAYDRILYPSYLHEQTQPDRLAVMARFFGMSPAPVERCRMLELGCGTGSTLLAFAYGLTECEFVGVDLGEKQIALGREAQSAVGVTNLNLIHGDIMKIGRAELGEFDYIVAHGVYSWVPEPVRERLLAIYREMLAAQGIGFISYNALPGGHIRQMTREMMQYHTRHLDDPSEKVQQSLALMKFITEGAANDKLYHKIYESELATLVERNPENIFHDDLADINQPFYLYQFVENAARHGLKYFSDVQYFSTRDLTYPRAVIETLESMGEDTVMREQYLDFLNCRRFRQSLVCHADVPIDRVPGSEMLNEIRIASHVKPVSAHPELASKKVEEFVGPKVQNVEIDHPLTKAALYYLGKIWPRSAIFDDVKLEAAKLLSPDRSATAITSEDEAILREILMRIFGSGLVEFRTIEPTYADNVSVRPTASRLARWQAARGDTIFNLRYDSLDVGDPLGRKLIEILDGSLDRGGISETLKAFVMSDELDADRETREKLVADIEEGLEKKLDDLADLALLTK